MGGSARRGLRLGSSLSIALAALTLGAACGSSERPTRVVLVTLDTLRYDGLEHRGPVPLMPNLGRLAEEGQSFTNFWSTTATTQPTHASLLTGRLPFEHGVVRNGLELGDEQETVTERLGDAGFETRAVVASFPLDARYGFAQGFDHYDDAFDEPYVRVWEGEETESGTFYSLAESVTDRAVAAIDAAEAERQFFWFHYFDPHDPYGTSTQTPAVIQSLLALCGDPGIDAAIAETRRLYESDVRALDRALGRLFDRLREEADAFETHVVVTSDHGESFGESGALGHGKRLTPEQIHVPLVLWSPALAPGRRSEPASSIDVAPTLLSLAGLGTRGFAGGRFGAADLAAAALPEREVVGMRRTFAEPKKERTTDGERHALEPAWFFVVRGDELVTGNGARLLAEDDRARPLAEEAPATAEIRVVFGELTKRLVDGVKGRALEDEESLEALESLGYFGEDAAH